MNVLFFSPSYPKQFPLGIDMNVTLLTAWGKKKQVFESVTPPQDQPQTLNIWAAAWLQKNK